MFHECTKHIEIRLHFIKELVVKVIIQMIYYNINE